MYLREALMQCRDLEAEVAHVYEELAALHSSDRKLAQLWRRLAHDERAHARILSALLAAEEVQEDDGPFVVDLRERIVKLRKLVDRGYQAARAGVSPQAAMEIAEEIESSEIDGLFTEVLDLARPALDRLISIVARSENLSQRHQQQLARYREQHPPATATAGTVAR